MFLRIEEWTKMLQSLDSWLTKQHYRARIADEFREIQVRLTILIHLKVINLNFDEIDF